MKILDVLYSPWAIVPTRLIEIQSIYATHLRGEKIDIAGVEAKLGRPLKNEPQGYTVRNGTALVPLQGAVSKRMNLMSQISGGASAELLVRDMQAAMDDPSVQSIVLMVDSPGGTVDGTQAAAEAIYAMRGKGKPIAAFCDGMMASAAYWIGSAADSVWIDSNTAQVGSIGVLSTHTDVSQREKALGLKTTEIYAGKYKRIASSYEPLTKAGRDSIQAQVDYLYSVFVGDVAKHRGVSEDKVLADMADGRIFTGKQAVEAGLVDGVSSLDALISSLNGRAAGAASRTSVGFKATSQGTTMDPKDLAAQFAAENPDAAAMLRAEGAEGERTRIASVREQSMAGHEALIEALAADGKTTGPEAAMQVLAAEKARKAGVASARSADAPSVVPTSVEPEDKAPAASGMKAPAGFQIDAGSADLDRKAKAYIAAHPGTDYLAAIKIVSN